MLERKVYNLLCSMVNANLMVTTAQFIHKIMTTYNLLTEALIMTVENQTTTLHKIQISFKGTKQLTNNRGMTKSYQEIFPHYCSSHIGYSSVGKRCSGIFSHCSFCII